MTVGVRIRDRLGRIVLDFNDRITRVIGTYTTGTTNGSISIPALAGGTPWYIIQDPQLFNDSGITPAISFSGTTMTWTFPALQSGQRAVAITIILGLY